MADSPADSTMNHAENHITILDSFEKMLDKKLRPLETKLCLIEKNQEDLRDEHDKLIDKIVKVKNIVDDLNELTDKETRKIKDEIYNVQDTMDAISEKVSDIKNDSRDNVKNIESTLDKVVKIHKHLKVQEVTNLISPKHEKQHSGHENENTKSADNCLQILSDDIVPELKVIKSLLKLPTVEKRPDNLNLDLDFDDINRSINTLTNDIQEINKKIAQNEENTKLFHSFKEALLTNNEKLGQEVKNTICHELSNSSNCLVELSEKMHKYEEELMKKTVEIKKCVIEESTENLKVLQETKNETKMSLLNTTSELLKNVALKKDQITKEDLKQKNEQHFIDFYTKIEILREDLKSALEESFKKNSLQMEDKNHEIASSQKTESDKKFGILKSDLEKSLTKVHLDSFKEMSKLVNKNVKMENFEEFSRKMEKSMTELKSKRRASMMQENSENSNLSELKTSLEQSINDLTEKISEKLDSLSSLEPSVVLELKDLRNEIEKNQNKKKSLSSIQKMLKKQPEIFKKDLEKFAENFDLTEILNTMEDLKQLTSSLPSTVLELNPKFDQMETQMQKSTEDLTTKLRVLEGSIIDKNTKTHQQSLEHIIKKFDMVESKFAVIRKYVKMLGNFDQNSLCPSPSPSTSGSLAMSTVHHPRSPTSASILSESGGVERCTELKLHMNNQCKILGDSIASALDKFLPMVDTTKVRKLLEEMNKTLPTLHEVKDLVKEISEDQAKASVVEDQLQALATTILEPIEELKPIQDQLLSTIEEEIRSLSQTSTNHDAFDTLNMNQSLILKQLKKSSSPNSDDSVLTSWIENLVEELKKVQGAQVVLIQKSEIQNSLMNSLTDVLPMLENNQDLKEKIEMLTEAESNHQSMIESQDEVKSLIKDIKALVDSTKESGCLLDNSRRRKGRKRSMSGRSRSRKASKLSYNSEDEDA